MAAAHVPNGEPDLSKKLAHVQLENEKPQDATTTDSSTQPSSVAASLKEKPVGPLKTPIVGPVESAVPSPPPTLTADQQAKYESLLETAKSWKDIPAKDGKGGPVTDNEIMWLSRECLLRYLRATKWNTADAAKRVMGTLTWRREYGTEDLTGDHISPENETGKQLILGYDIAARPCHYLSPGRQNTAAGPRQVQHLVFMVERVIEMMVPGQETLALLINFKGSTSKAPAIGLARECLNILQTHYPERLGRAMIINLPWILNGFFKLITPFIDPMTREKMKFNPEMRQIIPPEQLWKDFQGDLEFEYDHKTYWPALLKLCEEKHSEVRERWVKAGKHYGESEIYMKGGNGPSVGTAPEENTSKTITQKADTRENGKEKENSPLKDIESQANIPAKEPVSESTTGVKTSI